MTSLRRIGVLVLIISLSIVDLGWAGGWPCRSDSTVPVCIAGNTQWNVRLASDGHNGTIVVWQDRRNGGFDKIYTQALDQFGSALWQDGGIQLANTPGYQYYPQVISDGSGGAIIVWQDNRNGLDYDIFAQRVSSAGVLLWTANGVPVCTATGHQYNPQIVSDNNGGVVISWQDRRSGEYDIYAQRLDLNGQATWAANGLSVCGAVNDQVEPKMVSDGHGGIVISWLDYRAANGYPDIFCQHIHSNGGAMWINNGVPVCTAPNTQWNHQIISDGHDNCIVVWQDRRSGLYDNVYAQKINANGDTVWTNNGIPLAQVPGQQYYPQIASDNAGGFFAVWEDNRSGLGFDIYAQHVNAAGQLVWASTGLPVCTSSGYQYNPQIASQGSYAIITWQDKRGNNFDIYAQRVSSLGVTLWNNNGTAVAALPYDQFNPQIVGDGVDGAIIAWVDYHLGGSSTDIFAHRIGANGKLAGGCYRTFTQTGYSLKAARMRRSSIAPITSMPNEGNVRDSIFGRGAYPQGIALGVERWDSARSYGWEYFTRRVYVRRAFAQNGDPRPFDRILDHVFRGVLKNRSAKLYNNSLAGELLALKLNIAASDVGLTDGGFGDLVYNDSLPSVSLLNNKSLRQITGVVDTLLTFYRRYPANYVAVTAALGRINNAFAGVFDTVSANPMLVTSTHELFSLPYLIPGSDPPDPLPAFVPQTDDEEQPSNFVLLQNYPNPFNPYTTIEFLIPEPSVVTLKVFNILGQEVATLVDHSTIDGGHQVVDFDASRLSSGVYFYQLVSDPISGRGKLVTRVNKMLLVK